MESCQKEGDRKKLRKVLVRMERADVIVFFCGSTSIRVSVEFKYLGRVLNTSDCDKLNPTKNSQSKGIHGNTFGISVGGR